MIVHAVTFEHATMVPADFSEIDAQSLVSFVLNAEGIDKEWTVGIQFVNDDDMRMAHKEFMDIDEPTDIMTFPYADEDDVWGDSELGGDLMISVDRATENASEENWTPTDELYFLIAHGVLHLVGWDDHVAADRVAMLNRQRDLISNWRRDS